MDTIRSLLVGEVLCDRHITDRIKYFLRGIPLVAFRPITPYASEMEVSPIERVSRKYLLRPSVFNVLVPDRSNPCLAVAAQSVVHVVKRFAYVRLFVPIVEGLLRLSLGDARL